MCDAINVCVNKEKCFNTNWDKLWLDGYSNLSFSSGMLCKNPTCFYFFSWFTHMITKKKRKKKGCSLWFVFCLRCLIFLCKRFIYNLIERKTDTHSGFKCFVGYGKRRKRSSRDHTIQYSISYWNALANAQVGREIHAGFFDSKWDCIHFGDQGWPRCSYIQYDIRRYDLIIKRTHQVWSRQKIYHACNQSFHISVIYWIFHSKMFLVF